MRVSGRTFRGTRADARARAGSARDEEIENFVAKDFFEVKAHM